MQAPCQGLFPQKINLIAFSPTKKLSSTCKYGMRKKIIVHKGVFSAIRKDDIPNCSKSKINNSLRGGAKVRKSKSEM
jgi:hypothetical protein